MNTIKTKAVIYCRVSSKEQEETGYSLPAQEKFLREYAQKPENNFDVVKVFQVSESAGGKIRRKIFHEMMEYIKANNISVVIVETTDRLTRNFADVPTIDAWILEDDTHQIHLAKESCVLNKNSKSHEWFMWRVKVATAEYYVRLLSENVLKGQKEKLAQGWLPTKPPLGYKTVGDKGHKIHVIDDWGADENGNKILIGTAKHIKWMFDQYATGNYSIARLEQELYEAGLRTRGGSKLGMSRIHILLQDPFYYGNMRWNGEVKEAKHEALIDKDVFKKVQTILKRQIKNPRFMKHNSLFKSKITCAYCEGTLTWYIKKGHWYGHCNNHGVYARCEKKTCIRQERVEEQYVGIFDVIAPKSEEVLVEIENILWDEHAQHIGQREQEVTRISRLLENVRKDKDKYYEAKINREVPLEYCERKIAECTKEEEALETTLAHVGNKNDEFLQLGLVVHELAYKSKEIYELADVDEKRLLLSQLFTNFVQKERKIETFSTPIMAFMQKWIPKLNESYELKKSLNNDANKGKADSLVSASPIWLPN